MTAPEMMESFQARDTKLSRLTEQRPRGTSGLVAR